MSPGRLQAIRSRSPTCRTQTFAASAAEKTRYAIWSLEAAEEGGGDALGEARRLLEAPCAKCAASALMAIDDVAKSRDTGALGAVKAAERAVRGVVVLRCLSQAEPRDRFKNHQEPSRSG